MMERNICCHFSSSQRFDICNFRNKHPLLNNNFLQKNIPIDTLDDAIIIENMDSAEKNKVHFYF